MDKISNIILTCILFLALYIFTKIHSRFEKLFIKERPTIIKRHAVWSLIYFKYFLLILLAIGSVEAIYFNYQSFLSILVGIILFIIGITFRILAIYSLGSQWSFHSDQIKNQRIINHGIYIYLKHPAYIGNIFICGLFLLIGAIRTSFLSIILVFSFYCIRSRIEDNILKKV